MAKKLTVVVVSIAAVIVAVRARVGAVDGYTFTPIDAPSATETVATGIDSLGRIVGHYTDARGTHGFLLTGNTFSTIDAPGAKWTAAYGINGAGQIVGAFGPDGQSGRHGFLQTGGSFVTLDVPNGADTVARDDPTWPRVARQGCPLGRSDARRFGEEVARPPDAIIGPSGDWLSG